jgi:hypothetical protein
LGNLGAVAQRGNCVRPRQWMALKRQYASQQCKWAGGIPEFDPLDQKTELILLLFWVRPRPMHWGSYQL